MSKILKGENLMLFADGKSIAFATSHSLEISLDTREISTKDHGGKWTEAEAGKINWTISSENLVGNPGEGSNYDTLLDLMIARQPIDVVFALEGDSTDFEANKLDYVPTGGWSAKTGNGRKGKAIITSLSCSAPNAEYATMSATFTGVGELSKVGNISEAAKAKMSAPTAQTASK